MRNIIKSVVEITRFFDISKWPLSLFWSLEFAKFYCLTGSVNSLQSYQNFFTFHDGGNLPSWICLGHVWMFGEYLVVSVTLHNLVMIDAVVSIILMFQYLLHLAG